MENMSSFGGAIESMNQELAKLRQSNLHFPITFEEDRPVRHKQRIHSPTRKQTTVTSNDNKPDRSESEVQANRDYHRINDKQVKDIAI